MHVLKPLILVVDDETHILHVLSLKLGNAGYRVVTAEDGEEALELAKNQHPDLIITDDQMPYLTGMQLCAKLRADDSTCEIPTLLLTARDSRLSKESLGELGIAEVFTKPFSPREILSRVQELVGLNPEWSSGYTG